MVKIVLHSSHDYPRVSCYVGPGANSTEEEAQPKSGNAYKMAFGVLAPVVVGCVICIGGVLLYQNNKKG
ncbi:hypothetical protein Y1Q_0003588 [Alligator mississippiensis]|uniref:Uncharacterized protein n=1 Tax=Alligator mississippiensis TaxID=8496 RepID=A0A151MRL8_ALLMI|nr:hypothetical protein Y1Q_0003588 [Alligator mississippiensis]